MIRTYRLDRLYFQFLKPFNKPISTLDLFAYQLFKQGFIEIHDITSPQPRYSPNAKLTDHLHQKELFKLVAGL